MPGNLRDIREIESEIESAGLRGITKAQILDLLRSQSKVAGVLVTRGGSTPFTVQAGWNRIDTWTRAVDTQGVRDGLNDAADPGGYYLVGNAAAGDYTCSAMLRCSVSQAGKYELRLATVDSADAVSPTLYQDEVQIDAPGVIQLVIASALLKDMAVSVDGVRKRRIQLELRGPNGAEVTMVYGQFGVQR